MSTFNSAADCVSPAIENTKAVMFRPFRFSHWWRVALIGMATTAFGTANGCNLAGFGDLREALKQQPRPGLEALEKIRAGISDAQIASIITTLVVGLVVLAITHIYVNSVARFMLFDFLTSGGYRLRHGWDKWHSKGLSLFVFQFLLALFATAGLTVITSVITRAFSSAGAAHPGMVAAGALLAMCFTFLLSIVLLAFHSLTVDFAVPVMALENVSLGDAVPRVWQMVAAAPVDYLLYLLMKVLLRIVTTILLLMIEVICLVLPVVIVIVVLAVVAGTVSRSNPVIFIALLFTTMVVSISAIWLLAALVAAPVYVFFQAYVLNFFSSRYPPLWKVMHPVQEPPPLPSSSGPTPEPMPAM